MILAALLIGAIALLAIRAGQARSHEDDLGSHRRWLVLPDEPRLILALPAAEAVQPSLPAIVVTRPSWSACGEAWRAEKPMKPWFQGSGGYAVAAALGVVSLDLSALGLGVPEIFPTHLPVHHDGRAGGHDHEDRSFAFGDSFDAWTAAHPGVASDLSGVHQAAWDDSAFIVPPWERAPDHHHDWWAAA